MAETVTETKGQLIGEYRSTHIRIKAVFLIFLLLWLFIQPFLLVRLISQLSQPPGSLDHFEWPGDLLNRLVFELALLLPVILFGYLGFKRPKSFIRLYTQGFEINNFIGQVKFYRWEQVKSYQHSTFGTRYGPNENLILRLDNHKRFRFDTVGYRSGIESLKKLLPQLTTPLLLEKARDRLARSETIRFGSRVWTDKFGIKYGVKRQPWQALASFSHEIDTLKVYARYGNPPTPYLFMNSKNLPNAHLLIALMKLYANISET